MSIPDAIRTKHAIRRFQDISLPDQNENLPL